MNNSLLKIALNQRYLILALLASILMQVGSVVAPPALATVFLFGALGAGILSIIAVARLQQALGRSVLIAVLTCVLLLLPLIGIITMLLVNQAATKRLREGGLKVGLMGVPADQITRLKSAAPTGSLPS
jgi:hypothetical protein